MICGGCGNTEAYRVRGIAGGPEVCNQCGEVGTGSVDPDVYFPGPYYDPHLAHPDRPDECKRGVFVESKRHKLALMKEQGLREAGDRRGGAINFDKRLAQRAREEGFGPS